MKRFKFDVDEERAELEALGFAPLQWGLSDTLLEDRKITHHKRHTYDNGRNDYILEIWAPYLIAAILNESPFDTEEYVFNAQQLNAQQRALAEAVVRLGGSARNAVEAALHARF